MINVVVGLQYGDEGKAKVFHSLLEHAGTVRTYNKRYVKSAPARYAIRWNGGPNAGHTVWVDGKKHVFHQVPSGVIVDNCISIIARGCAFDPKQYELEQQEFGGTCLIDIKCPVILPMFVDRDKKFYQEGIGTTAKGIGPTFSSFIARDAILVEDLLDIKKTYKKLCRLNILMDAEYEVADLENEATRLHMFARKYSESFIDGKKVIHNLVKNHEDKYISFEGSQGYSLDPYVGEYPYVTSSGTNVSYLLWTLGLSRKTPMEVIGVMKPYVTYVGSRENWPEEFNKEKSDRIRILGGEYGATTGRDRRIGGINFVELNESIEANGVDKIALTKVDLIEKAIGKNLQEMKEEIFKKTNTYIGIISNGPDSKEWEFNE